MRLRRLLAMLVVAATVAGACGGSEERGDAASGRFGSSEPDTGTSSEDGRPSTDADGGAETTTTVAGGGQSPAGTQPRQPSGGGGSSSPGSSTGGGSSRPPAQSTTALGPPGSLARAVLGRRAAANVVLEVSQQAAPRPGTLDYVARVLQEVADKPVERPPVATLASDDTVWTASDIRAAADRMAKVQQSQSTAVLRLLFLRGRFDGEDDVEGVALGVAVRGDVAAIFVEEVARAARPLLDPSVVEQAVTTHELGHLLGLVDLVLKTGRADPEHPEHSRNPQSVMYWAVESDLVAQVIAGEPPRRFDREDLADLAAIRDSS